MSLGRDLSLARPVERPTAGKVIALPRVGGLHPRSSRGRLITTRFSPRQRWPTADFVDSARNRLGSSFSFLIRDRYEKFGVAFDALARFTCIRVIRVAVRAPDMNAACERLFGSLRRECLDPIRVLDETATTRRAAVQVSLSPLHRY
jgi:hypothetical protein